jgi:hypothetical protein
MARVDRGGFLTIVDARFSWAPVIGGGTWYFIGANILRCIQNHDNGSTNDRMDRKFVDGQSYRCVTDRHPRS